jgi:hypothetical protein
VKISDLLVKLQSIKDEHGDLPIVGDHGIPDVEVLNEQDEFDICVYIG